MIYQRTTYLRLLLTTACAVFLLQGQAHAQYVEVFDKEHPALFGRDRLQWFPMDDPTTAALWPLFHEFKDATGVPVYWCTIEYTSVGFSHPRELENWENQGQDFLEFLVYGRPFNSYYQWPDDITLLVPDRLRKILPEEITDQVMEQVVVPLCAGQPVSLIIDGQIVDCWDYAQPDSVQKRAAMRWGVESLLHYVERGYLPQVPGLGPEQYTAYFEPHPQQVGSLDDGTEAPAEDYPPITIKDTVTGYPLVYKAMGTSGTDYLRFRWEPALKEPIPGLYAATETGQELTLLDSTTLQLSGLTEGTHQVGLYAPIEGRETDLLLGQVTVAVYPIERRTLHLIPVGAERRLQWDQQKTRELADSLNAIYNPVGVHWEVLQEDRYDDEYAWDYNRDGLHLKQSGMLTAYPKEAKDLIKAWTSHYKTLGGSLLKDDYYLFLVYGGGGGSGYGFMPRKRQFGFIFNNAMLGEFSWIQKTVAHELGHGVFRFPHWWEEAGTYIKSTDNLMDYRKEGTDLRYRQWEQIRNPPSVATLLEDDDDAAIKDAYRTTFEILDLGKGQTTSTIHYYDDEAPDCPGLIKKIQPLLDQLNRQLPPAYRPQLVISSDLGIPYLHQSIA
ncbi:MAG: hypothetical protein AAFQ98_21235, partial [Bacteroidota bacterium]